MAFEMQQVTNHLSLPMTSMIMEEPMEETIDFFGTNEPEPVLEPPKAQHREERGKARRRDKRREVREEPEVREKEPEGQLAVAAKEPVTKTEETMPKPRFQRKDRDRKQRPAAGASSEPAMAQAPAEAPVELVAALELELVDITALERQLLASPARVAPEAETPSQAEAQDAAVSGPGEEVNSKERKKRFKRGNRHEKPRSAEADAGSKAEGGRGKEMGQARDAAAPVPGRQEQSQPVVLPPPVAEQPPAVAVAPSMNPESPTEPQQGRTKTGGHQFRGGQRRDNKVEGKENRKQTRRPHQASKGPTGGLQPPPQRNQ